MDKRKNLHDYSMLLIFLAAIDVFNFVATVVSSIIDGSFSDALVSVESDMVNAVKIALIIVAALMVIMTLAEAFIGFKGLKISREPNADKGYITMAKVFLVISIIASISFFVTFFDGKTPIIDTALNFVAVVLDVAIYIIFIKTAKSVRSDFLAEKK